MTRAPDHLLDNPEDTGQPKPELTPGQKILETMARHKLTLESVFVPWSQSRDKDSKDERGNPVRTFQYVCTLKRDGRPILMTGYGMGIAHSPTYKATGHGKRDRYIFNKALAWETEHGIRVNHMCLTQGYENFHGSHKNKILPEPESVMHCLIMDSDVLDAGGFESWASDFGYDTDSRKAESIYKACLEIALKLRAGLGESIMAELREAGQDY